MGANDAANIFGTAVGTRMIRFRTAALLASAGVIGGAVFGGAGTTGTLGALGAVNAMAVSFTVALTAAVTVAWMSRTGLPVSTSQAIVGAIIGWNLFTGSPTDPRTLAEIVGALAIAVGIHAHSYGVMTTVGNQLFALTPVLGLLVVLAHNVTLLDFSSETLHRALLELGMPAPPLVPISSTQAIIGAIIGIALIKGGRGLHVRTLGRVALGWIMTPIMAAVLGFVLLFVVQNVFEQMVVRR